VQPHADSPEHSTNSDAVNGASAVLLYAQAMGHKTAQMGGSFATPEANSILFVFTPTSPYTADEADRLRAWVRDGGGLLIYASEEGDPELDRAFDVSRFDGVARGDEYGATPAVTGVATVAGGASVVPIDPDPEQGDVPAHARGYSAGFVQRVGGGRVVVLADPLWCSCNGYLERPTTASCSPTF
jgi:hypothetical protein